MIDIERISRRTKAVPLTSLIDVVFLLMVFFILTTHFVKVEALKLAVADDAAFASQGADGPVAHELVLLGSGAAFLNEELIYYDSVEDSLNVLFAKYPGSQVIVKCDRQISVQHLVDVLDMIKRGGGGEVTVAHWQNKGGK